ncbi:PAS domain S-box protein [Geothrix fuzhouensis]|uniref:PAS domain S-box protein n=1 Tax=Geothrix fuzhouensis TaxID=2966451 RepID=UPI0021493F00|nr:PAS domain S-box protein [Geothrix fuzhouensis]
MRTDPLLMQKVARRVVIVLCLAIVALAGLAILGTIIEARQLAALGRDNVPMSPLGAGLLLLLAGAILVAMSRFDPARARRVTRGVALGVFLLGLGVVGGYLLGRLPVFGRWAALGRQTSLLSGLAVSLAALSAFTRWSGPRPRWQARQWAALLAQIPLVIGTVVLVSYASGAPLLYESGITPMSLPSAFCSVGLGLALMIAAGCDTWPLAVFGFVPGKGRDPQRHWFSTGPLALFLLLGVLVLSGGSFFLRGQLKTTQARVHSELSTIAEFKAHQIEDWFGERRADADRIFRGAMIQGDLRRFLAGASPATAEPQVRAWMEDLQKGTYQQMVLFDRQGRVRVAVPSGRAFSPDGRDASELQAALRAKEVLVRDLHQNAGKTGIQLSLWVPIGASPEPCALAEGALLLRMDPQNFLLPLVQSWPTASPTAEALLVRREGGDVLYLSELRHRAQPAMSLRRPLGAEPLMLALLSTGSQKSFVAGLDYRGEPVLATLHPIEGTAWSMVAKVDETEVYGPLRQRVWLGGIGLLGVVVLVAAGLGLMVRHHDAEMIREQLNLSQRFEWLMRQANDIIFLMNEEGWIQEANAQAVEHYGYTLSELKVMQMVDLRSPEARDEAQKRFALLRTIGSIRFETVHRRKDGSTFPVEVSAKLVHLEGEAIVISFVRDITEQQAQQRELRRMTQLYAALSQVNQAIVWTDSREALFAKVCRVLVEFGRFSMAWVGWNDPATHRVAVAAQYGDTMGYLEALEVHSDDTPTGHGPMGTAIREGQPSVLNDYLNLPESDAWREAALRSGFASAAAFPIRQGGEVVGALAVYATEKDFFGTPEAALLIEAALDVSYALDHLVSEERRCVTEAALKESERLLREAQEAGGIGTYTWDIQQDQWTSSLYLDRIFGIGPDHPRTVAGWLNLIAPEARDQLQASLAGAIERRERFNLDYPIIRFSDGARRWVRDQGELHLDAKGQPVTLVGAILDITEQKEDELALRKVSVAVEQSPLSVVITDRSGTIEYVNPRFTQATGYTYAEVIGENPRILKSPSTPPEVYRQLWDTLTRGEVWVGEFENVRKDGTRIHERATIAPVRDAIGTVTSYIALEEDITEQKRAEEKHRALEAQLHQSQKLESLGSLAGGVAHDMNNVLGAILGMASALKESSDLPAASAKRLNTIINACLRGRGVVKSLLYFAHKDLQEEQPIDLNQLVREMGQLLAHTTLKRISLDLDLQDSLGTLRGDGGALSHALMNLCVNAVDAMPSGGILRIQTRATADGGVALHVSDTGEGMRPEVLERAMEPFFTTKPHGKGTGLGLAMVYATMKAHDGVFELCSQVGQGTEAILQFPASRLEPGGQVENAPLVPVDRQVGSKILLVDDDELIRESMTSLLEMLGYEVTPLPGGASALGHLEAGLPADLVILDMNMPGMTGGETLPYIKALRPDLAVLMVSGYSDQDIAPLIKQFPRVSGLQKPYSMVELQQKLAGFGLRPVVET